MLGSLMRVIASAESGCRCASPARPCGLCTRSTYAAVSAGTSQGRVSRAHSPEDQDTDLDLEPRDSGQRVRGDPSATRALQGETATTFGCCAAEVSAAIRRRPAHWDFCDSTDGLADLGLIPPQRDRSPAAGPVLLPDGRFLRDG